MNQFGAVQIDFDFRENSIYKIKYTLSQAQYIHAVAHTHTDIHTRTRGKTQAVEGDDRKNINEHARVQNSRVQRHILNSLGCVDAVWLLSRPLRRLPSGLSPQPRTSYYFTFRQSLVAFFFNL